MTALTLSFKDMYSCIFEIIKLGTKHENTYEWQRLTSQVEIQIRDDLSTGKYYIPTIIKSHVYYP